MVKDRDTLRTRLLKKNNGFIIPFTPNMSSVHFTNRTHRTRRTGKGCDWSWVEAPESNANDVSKGVYAYTVLTDFFEQCWMNGMPDHLHIAYSKAVEDLTASKKDGIDAEAKHFEGDENSANVLASAGVLTVKQIAELVPTPGPVEVKEFVSQEECLSLFKEKVMERGQLKRKTQAAMIRPAINGERVVTVVAGKTTSDTVVCASNSWVVKAPTAYQEEYVLSAEKFEANWDVDGQTPEECPAYPNRQELEAAGFKAFSPKLVLKWMYKIEEADLKPLPSQILKTDWGVGQEIKIGDYFVVPYPESRAKEVYIIPQEIVATVYADYEETDFLLLTSPTSHQLQNKILQSTSFDRTTRGNVGVDVGILLHGFREPFNLLYRYQIEEATLSSWIQAIAGQYTPGVQYHAWAHAFDVFQFLYLSLTLGDSEDHFSFQDILALLLAALSHDVGHMGTTNAFQISTQADLAIRYNDKSPLENMHSSVFFETLKRPGLNFLGAMNPDNFRNFRTKVIDSILATDMSHHFELIDSMSVTVAKAKDQSKRRKSEDFSAKENTLLLQAFMHTSDLGHCCRPFDVHKNIVVLLEEEFFNQGDQERERGMPISPMMDRTKDSAASGQSFFLTKLVFPLIDPYTFFLAPEYAASLKEATQDNIDRWVALCHKYMPPGAESKTAKAIIAAES